jgi:predicted HicB family RNase H-like nuclease
VTEKKTVSKAQQKATAKYKKSNYDRMEILLSKGRKTDLQDHATKAGQSLNAYVVQAVDERIERENA